MTGEEESAARAGLYLLTADVTMQSHTGHSTRGCILRVVAGRNISRGVVQSGRGEVGHNI